MTKPKTKSTAVVHVADTRHDLAALADGIREDLKAAQAGIRTTVERMGAIGEKLNQAKTLLGQRGKWEAWVEENTPFKLRTAQLYMRFARELPKAQRVALSTVRDALEQLAPPPPPEPDARTPLPSPARPFRSLLEPSAPAPRHLSDSPLRKSQAAHERQWDRVHAHIDAVEDAIAKFWKLYREVGRSPIDLEMSHQTSESLTLLGDLYLGALRHSAGLDDSIEDTWSDDILAAARAVDNMRTKKLRGEVQEIAAEKGPLAELAAEVLKLEGETK